ncbi:MAG TPA: PDZ domain-containing protein [Candidatus Dormibacteraeota bacterium]|nr:PDZ domain-containing protein [Candidatus Dormibacteraeota bacterium]
MKRQITVVAVALIVVGIVAFPLQSAMAARQRSNPAATKLHEKALLRVDAEMARAQETLDELPQKLAVLSTLDDGASWLGVETAEVTSDKVKQLRLPAERGVVLTEIVPDSPAAKAGLKSGDVVTEFNGQHIEGASQFRRLIRETPAGRSVQLTLWRDGRSQTISAVLGQGEQGRQMVYGETAPGETFFKAPYTPRIELPRFEFGGDRVMFGRPILGISAENLSGQLGSYFGAPDGEGILVREVSSGSSAEKAGIKAGDVITKVDGDRVRSVGELREKLFEKVGDKGEKKAVSVALWRDHKEMTVNVEVERPQTPKVRGLVGHRRSI